MNDTDTAPPAAAASEPAAPVRPWEDWGEAKKLLTRQGDRVALGWQLAAARHHADWPAGREVTEEAFDKAVNAARTARIG